MYAGSGGGSGGFTVVPTQLLAAEVRLEEIAEQWGTLAAEVESLLLGAARAAGDVEDALAAAGAVATSSLDGFSQHSA